MNQPTTLAILLIAICSGCQHTHLRMLTTRQGSTLTDLHYQQVLDNLAHSVQNPQSMPHFVIPAGGLAQVDTSGEGSFGIEWPATVRNIGLGGSRATSGNWELQPVNEADKLHRMQCAYQLAIGCVHATGCQTCDEVFSEMFGDQAECRKPRTGWFRIGRKKDIPKNACYWGSYCDTYVWVCRDGVGELTHLTSVILDFALRSPEPDPLYEVTYKPVRDSTGKTMLSVEGAKVLKSAEELNKTIQSQGSGSAEHTPETDPSETATQQVTPGALMISPDSLMEGSSPRTYQDKGFPTRQQRAIRIQ